MTEPIVYDSTKNVNTLQTWGQTFPPSHELPPTNKTFDPSPFPYDEELNNRICLWRGDITKLKCTCIVSSTNEQLNDNSSISERLHETAGPLLKQELANYVKNCPTGCAKLTSGFNLPSEYIAHCVGPRFNAKYQTASENVLFYAYRSLLELIQEKQMCTIAVCCLHSYRRGYPVHDGAHIAIRTIRRFLEKSPENIATRIVFVVNPDEEIVYNSILALYFPRCHNEMLYSLRHMPKDTGNQQGAPINVERCIRINGKLNGNFEESVDISKTFDTSIAVGEHSFAKMTVDIDRKKKHKLESNSEKNIYKEKTNKSYERLLAKAKHMDFSDISSARCLFCSGYDKYGRTVVIFVADNFKSRFLTDDRALLYFINLMDAVSKKEFIFVYFHSLINRKEQPDIDFFQTMKSNIHTRYASNLKYLYFLNSNIWSKIITWYITRFLASGIKNKVQNILGLEYLYSHIDMDQLDLPKSLIDLDLKLNGTRYYDPDRENA